MYVLEHWITVQAEFILDHSVSNVSWHLLLGHLMCRKILSGETRAIDTGRELIITRSFEGDVFKTWNSRLSLGRSFELTGLSRDAGEVNHDCYLRR